MTRRFHGANPSSTALIASSLYSCTHTDRVKSMGANQHPTTQSLFWQSFRRAIRSHRALHEPHHHRCALEGSEEVYQVLSLVIIDLLPVRTGLAPLYLHKHVRCLIQG